jgi:hypothetical protein
MPPGFRRGILKGSMDPNSPIKPDEAEDIVKRVRAEHGLGQKYRLKVETTQRGWHVLDRQGRVDSVPPMAASSWRKYLEERFVEAITEHDETSEA